MLIVGVLSICVEPLSCSCKIETKLSGGHLRKWCKAEEDKKDQYRQFISCWAARLLNPQEKVEPKYEAKRQRGNTSGSHEMHSGIWAEYAWVVKATEPLKVEFRRQSLWGKDEQKNLWSMATRWRPATVCDYTHKPFCCLICLFCNLILDADLNSQFRLLCKHVIIGHKRQQLFKSWKRTHNNRTRQKLCLLDFLPLSLAMWSGNNKSWHFMHFFLQMYG